MTYRRTPQPNTTSNLPGPEQTFTYDSIGRLDRSTSLVNSSYVRYVYGPNYVETWSTVNTVADEAHTLQIVDGAGRVIATAKNHPGSVGGFSGQLTVYDAMGRAIKQSNPTETSVNIVLPAAPINPYGWAAAGDDAAGGWIYTQQSFDWKGRPRVTTNQDGTTKTASYTGCSCAGGEVVTLTDEGTIDAGVAKRRQQKIYSDVLGRTVKVELLNWEGGTPYSTTVNTYNVRDQITNTTQYAGAEGSGTSQVTTSSFDGYGRLTSKHIPEQAAGTATLYTYNNDDTVVSVTDARGASATHTYNNRHLLTGITYNAPAGITAAPAAAFSYDGAGNRSLMTDGLGSKSYTYDQLSRLSAETRTFTNVGTFTLTYDYNLTGQLKKITDASNTTINYGYDVAGQLTSVSGSDTLVGGVSNYGSGFQYRAWGGLKQATVGSLSSSLTYNSRVEVTNFNISGVVNENYDYHSDGRLSFVHNTTDNNFDRALFYDNVGRLTSSAAGGDARQDAGAVPFNETISYGAFNDITQRETETWGGGDYLQSVAYTNHRVSNWTYDSSGRITSIDNRTYTYDSAGRTATLTGQRWTANGYVATSTENGFDGEGQRARENSGTSGALVLSYYLRSTVLGAVVEEVNSSGQKQYGYVYTPSGTELALQVAGQNYVQFKQRSPLGTTERGAFSTGAASRTEFDPLGAPARTNPNTPPDHNGNPGDIPSGGSGSLDSRFNSMANPISGCMVDGTYMPCSIATRGEEAISHVEDLDPYYAVQSLTRHKKAIWVDEDTSYGVPTEQALLVYPGPGGHFEWIDDPDEVLETYTEPQKPKYPPVTEKDINIVATSPSFDPIRNEVVASIIDIANNQKCSDAFKKWGIKIPYDVVLSDHINIAPQAFLANANAAQTLGVSQAAIDKAAYDLSDGYILQGGAAETLTGPGHKPALIIGQNITNPIYSDIKAVLIHEFIHAGGKPGSGSGANGDLTSFEGYKEIEEACGGSSK